MRTVLRECGISWFHESKKLINLYSRNIHNINYDKMASIVICTIIVCVEVLRPSQPNGVMSSAVSLPNHTFTGQA